MPRHTIKNVVGAKIALKKKVEANGELTACYDFGNATDKSSMPSIKAESLCREKQ